MGAELVRMEYKDTSRLYGIGAYTIACGVAFYGSITNGIGAMIFWPVQV